MQDTALHCSYVSLEKLITTKSTKLSFFTFEGDEKNHKTASREYLNDLNQIHELRLARLNFSDLALADLSSSRRSTESMAKREAITNLSKMTKHTRTILEVLRQEEQAKNRPLKNYRKFEH